MVCTLHDYTHNIIPQGYILFSISSRPPGGNDFRGFGQVSKRGKGEGKKDKERGKGKKGKETKSQRKK